ncbi:MAG: serine/threonine-protein kinase, partial [Pseudomonadota bacterium]
MAAPANPVGFRAMSPGTAMLPPDTLVDHFKVIRLLGHGGMGEVYLARDTKLGRRVALKVIRPGAEDGDEAKARLLREAQVTATFSHPNMVSIYTVGEYDGRLYLALEYLEGQTLRQRMDEERPGAKESMRIGLAIARALAEAHRHRVLHRDLKPENVLMARDGRPRVLDFGLAKVMSPTAGRKARSGGSETPASAPLGDNAPLGDCVRLGDNAPDDNSPTEGASTCITLAGSIYGTPAYMAPERWLGEEGTDTADVWALGVILYELLAGKRPFQTASIDELQAKICSSLPVLPLQSMQILPPGIAETVARCLEKDASLRPAASEVVTVFEQLLAGSKQKLSEEQSPFRGLFPFAERHSDVFFGRDAEVAAFLETIREQPVVPMVGPSGAGKSSLLQAGVIPRLREQGSWIVLQLRPGNEPFATLAARLERGETVAREEHATRSMATADVRDRVLDALADAAEAAEMTAVPTANAGELPLPIPAIPASHLAVQLFEQPRLLNVVLHEYAEEENSRILLFVDQLEEVYTLVKDDEVRRRFMQAICTAADDPQSPIRVVFTIRDDFLGKVAEGIEVGDALSRVVVVRRPGPEMLEEVLVKPLESVGYDYDDPTLVHDMIDSVRGEPACLPLLQFACRMLWDRRDRNRRVILRSTYQSMGGVAGALAEHADGVLEALSPAQVRLARELLLRLVTADGTRRVLPVSAALEGLGRGADEVLTRLTQARLLTVRKGRTEERGEAVIELVHESLVRSWSKLARWIEESHEELAFLAEIGQAVELWEKRGRREEEVWQGEALREARRMLSRCSTRVGGDINAFVEAGARKERRLQRRKKLLATAGMLALAGIAVASALVARQMGVERDRADAQRRQAVARHAEAQREGARAAWGRGEFLEARAKLRGSLEIQDSPLGRALWWQLSRSPLVWRRELGNYVSWIAFSADGKSLAATCADQTVYLYDTETAAVRMLR